MAFCRTPEMDELERVLGLECLYHEDMSGYPFFWNREKFQGRQYEEPTRQMMESDKAKLGGYLGDRYYSHRDLVDLYIDAKEKMNPPVPLEDLEWVFKSVKYLVKVWEDGVEGEVSHSYFRARMDLLKDYVRRRDEERLP